MIRSHWSIENSLHWQLDVLMARSARNQAVPPANLAVLRQLALNIPRGKPSNGSPSATNVSKPGGRMKTSSNS